MSEEIFGGGYMTLDAARALLGLSSKTWKALLTQVSTDDPVFVEKVNTTGATFSIKRDNRGEHILTASTGIFTENTGITFGINVMIPGEEGPNYAFEVLSETQIKIYSYSTLGGLFDDVMSNLLITIEI